jgi:transposase
MIGGPVPAVPASFIEPLWVQFCALLPQRGQFHPRHPLGTHRRRVPDRVVFDKLVQVLVFGCSYAKVADETCSATTLRTRRDEWIKLGVFARLKQIALGAYDRVVGLRLTDVAADGCVTKAPCGGEVAGRSPVDRGKQGTKRCVLVDAAGIPLSVVTAGANRHDSVLLAPVLDTLAQLGPLPERVTVHLDAGYDSTATRTRLAERGLNAAIARKGRPAPAQAGARWVVERTHSWHNAFKKLAICTERRATVINAFIDLADAIIILRRLIRQAWTTHRWDTRPTRRP